MPRCRGNKEGGTPCERIVGASQDHCYSHDPDRAAETRRNASRGRSNQATKFLGVRFYGLIDAWLEDWASAPADSHLQIRPGGTNITDLAPQRCCY